MILEAEHLGLCPDSMSTLSLIFLIYTQHSWQKKEHEAKPRGESEHVQFEKLEVQYGWSAATPTVELTVVKT